MRDQYSTGSFPTASSTGSYARPGARAARKSTRGKGFLFFAVALVISVFAGYLVLESLKQASAGAQPIKTVPVVVAAKDVPLGTTLTDEYLQVIQWPEETAPQTRVAEKELLVGRVAKVDLFEGEMVHDARLAPVEAGKGLNALIPSGMRAKAVKVTDESGVAGFIHPGDFVDVIAVFDIDDGVIRTVASRTQLQNIKVLAIGDQYQASEETRAKAMKVTVVTLLVTPQQAEQLELAATNGKIALTLRNGYDSEQVASTGFTPLQFIDENSGLASPRYGAKGKEPAPEEPAEEPKPKKEPKIKKEGKAKPDEVKPPADTKPPEDPGPPPVQVIKGDKKPR